MKKNVLLVKLACLLRVYKVKYKVQLIMRLSENTIYVVIYFKMNWVFFPSKVSYLKTHCIVRVLLLAGVTLWADFMVSPSDLVMVQLLLSHESILKILSISLNKNLSEQ